ncbi:MAG: phosphoglucosamine mutase [Bacteroidales bacterium]|nr:phosphoglucosamine mutase [Bacteroidales bacterium]
MSLIKSISGIRGTIGGKPGSSLTPPDLLAFTSAYAQWLSNQGKPSNSKRYRVVVGRDARISGEMVESFVQNTLMAMGIDVIAAGLATTPTVEMAVIQSQADGGIILTASHNPRQWNALKLLNHKGEFLSAADGVALLEMALHGQFEYAEVDDLGVKTKKDYLEAHIDAVLQLPQVNQQAIRNKKLKVVVDAVNSVGGFAIPDMLKALGVNDIICLNCSPDGNFAHNPEPLPENLGEICQAVVENKADLGIVVDPDVDRLAFINEDGSFFGEEYTLVAVSDYLLKKNVGNTVSNLSSSRALRDVTLKYGGSYSAAAVGEVNVVEMMKETKAVIGGEGNGGIIFPDLHYGRDALVGVALFLSHLVASGKSMKELKQSYPEYHMSKNKIQLSADTNPDLVLQKIQTKFEDENPITIDGVKIDFENSWVHLRKSNTEPIIRIYTEAQTEDEAEQLAKLFLSKINDIGLD